MFHTVEEIKDIIPSMQKEFLQLLEPVVFKESQFITQYDKEKQPLFILVEGHIQFFQTQLESEIQKYLQLHRLYDAGSIDEISLKEAKQNMLMKDKDITILFKAGEFFGYHNIISELEEKRGYALTKTQVKCLMIPYENLRRFVMKMYNSPEYVEKFDFIGDSIPQLSKVSRITRDRVTKCFKVEKFPPGHILFKEGEHLKQAYILKSGEVELLSNKNFKFIKLIQKLQPDDYVDEKMIFQKLLSKSLKDPSKQTIIDMYYKNTEDNFVLQLKESGQWIGEEGILTKDRKGHPTVEDLFNKQNFNVEVLYSAICKTQCEVYVIKRLDFITKMPKDIQRQLNKIVQQRQRFFYERMQSIAQTRDELEKSNDSFMIHSATEQHLFRKNPKAIYPAISSFKNQVLNSCKKQQMTTFSDVSKVLIKKSFTP
ncbi:UNKNOWN [Stylonychia lemnae]|uniref:Cyclic nucleotide-binding domain-containing protein n=1 Tax=Stylonychia lemnae TaxID=5949 RepID=A0A078AL95_STYLE|nr:UNKNOWN [Stylonychia lemnae]|eukprot:CDW83135.1 UNKNOWN [Stylonychia lemnae]